MRVSNSKFHANRFLKIASRFLLAGFYCIEKFLFGDHILNFL